MALDIIVTGGNGFLMKNLVEMHPEHNWIIYNSNQLNWVNNTGVELLPSNADVFIHSAAVYGGLVFNQMFNERILYENTAMNNNVFNWIMKHNPSKVITIGSGCVYPGDATGVLSEEQIGAGNMHPSVELYGMSKLWALTASRRLLKNWDHLVLGNMYGKYDHTSHERSHLVGALLGKFIHASRQNTDVQLIGTGIAQRDLVYVGDVVDVINRCIAGPSNNQPLNVSTGTGTSVRELAYTIKELIGFKGNIVWGSEKDNGALYKVLDCAKVDAIYPDRQRTAIQDGLALSLPYFLDII
jgi:GDP-L-fucose synthase